EDREWLINFAKSTHHLELKKETILGKVQLELFEACAEPQLIHPTFICDHPTDVSPLSRAKEDNPLYTDRFELVVAKMELVNAFSELNDPLDQRARFEQQLAERDKGDDEAHELDEDFLLALEYGMPPTGGFGMGIDRLVMLLTNKHSIREVICFPQLRKV
ncbi:MAG: amino acid--tRNA ligase-related protein, partial [Myxococcota bacterium]|nr:amino acid--tRNA ligase-related protein [Myxococcota bacterium]